MTRALSISARLALALALAGCGGGPAGPPAVTGPQAVFVAPADGVAPALQSDAQGMVPVVPWPSDLYLDGAGHVAPASLPPLQTTAATPRLLADLGTRDGFSVTTGAFFPVSDPIDPASLEGRVRLVDLEGGADVPLVVVWRPDDLLIHTRPANGHVLLQKHRYAYALLDGIVATPAMGARTPLQGSSDFQAIAAAATRPADARLGRAWDNMHALFQQLGGAKAIAAAAFTTESVTRAVASGRVQVTAMPAPVVATSYVFAAVAQAGDAGSLDALMGVATAARPGLDNPGGVTHGSIDFVVQGAFESLDFLAATSPTGDPTRATTSQLGKITEAADGSITPKGHATLPFTLVVPKHTDGNYAGLPVALFIHGIGGDRSAALGVADTLARAGFATLCIDLPFHGLRNEGAVDMVHNLTCTTGGCTSGADGFAEGTTTAFFDFVDVMGDRAHGVAALEPAVIRATWQQAAIDLVAAVRLVTDGNFADVGKKEPRLASLSLAGDRVMLVGLSLGGMVGTMALAIEPKLTAAVIEGSGGGLIFPLVTWSPNYSSLLPPLLESSVGINASDEPPESDVGYNLVQFLLEDGDPLAYAPYVLAHPLAGAAPRHVLFLEALHDETVGNYANEALAGGLGLAYASVTSGGAPDYRYAVPSPPVAKAPLSGNWVTAAGTHVTAAIVQFTLATHPMLVDQEGVAAFDDSTRPFKRLALEQTIDNPIDALQAMMAAFLGDAAAGRTPTIIDQ
jgi:dienelactone hydrolase